MDAENKQIEEQLNNYKSTYLMYENIIKETKEQMKDRDESQEKIDDRIALIKEAQNDVVNDYLKLGGKEEDLKKLTKRKTSKKSEMNDVIVEEKVTKKDSVEKYPESIKITDVDYIPERSGVADHEAYDIIPLPSRGECYSQKIKKLPVSYLTAYDENMIVSPNLYKDNLLIDTLLKEKILKDDIDPADLLEGDREAIILWLRVGGYGAEYPITAKDDITGEEFETTVDLSTIGFKKFTLEGDDNGWFSYTLPVSKKEVKFKFLTHRDNLKLKALEEEENYGLKKVKLQEISERLEEFMENDEKLEKSDRARLREAIKSINDWAEEITEEDEALYTHAITNRLQMSIMSVDGVTDRKVIRDFVKKMCVRDSSSLRKYITDNEPGVDYNLKIEKPKSLGGGSMNVFLQLDQFIFLNIA